MCKKAERCERCGAKLRTTLWYIEDTEKPPIVCIGATPYCERSCKMSYRDGELTILEKGAGIRLFQRPDNWFNRIFRNPTSQYFVGGDYPSKDFHFDQSTTLKRDTKFPFHFTDLGGLEY